jgi:hypothetical protein
MALGDAMSTPIRLDDAAEWLEADGQGGFASGTTGGLRTRRYHVLLLAATAPPPGRMVLVNRLDAWIAGENGGGHAGAAEYLTRQRYVPDLVERRRAALRLDLQVLTRGSHTSGTAR